MNRLNFMGMKRSNFWLIWLVFVATLVGCEKKVEPVEGYAPDFNRTQLLEDLSSLIYNSYQSYNSSIAELDESIIEFTNLPSESNLVQVRSNWSSSLLEWQKVAPFQFGLAADMAMEASTNIYPVSLDLIESNIESEAYNLSAASNLSAIGLQTIDYLIHGLGFTLEEHLEKYSTEQNSSKRAQYLKDVSSKLLAMSTDLLEEWKPGSIYRETFISNSGTSQGSSLGLFLNAFVKSFETSTRTNKIGIPSGAMTFSMTPLPSHVEALYENDNSIAYLQASINALETIYQGTDGNSSIKDYLDFLNAKNGNTSLNEAIVSAIADLRSSIALLQNPLSDFVESDQQAAMEVFSSMQNLVVLWKVDMMSALGILITYQDNDGD